YNVGATDTSTPAGTFTIQIASAEGAILDIPVGFSVIALVPELAASPSSLQAGMLRGSQAIVQLTLSNQGGAATGPLQVVLPTQAESSFLALASPMTIAPLGPGDSTPITILLTPPADLPLGTFQGSLIVQGATGSLTIPFSFINLSSAIGE